MKTASALSCRSKRPLAAAPLRGRRRGASFAQKAALCVVWHFPDKVPGDPIFFRQASQAAEKSTPRPRLVVSFSRTITSCRIDKVGLDYGD